MPINRTARKGVIHVFAERTLKREFLGFEAYLWAAQRVTGVVLIAFLVWHLYTLSSAISGPEAFDRVMQSMKHPFFKIGELFVVWIVLFHALNGLRLIFFNIFPGLSHKKLGYAAPIISLGITLICIPIIF